MISRIFGRPSRITLADRARDVGDWETAARHYRTALRRNPRNAPIWIQYGHALKESGEHARAEAAYRTAIESGPELPDAHLQLAHLLKVQGRIDDAKAAYLRAFAIGRSVLDAARDLTELCWSDAELSRLYEFGGSNPTAHALVEAERQVQERDPAAAALQVEIGNLREALAHTERQSQERGAAAAALQVEVDALKAAREWCTERDPEVSIIIIN